MKKNKDKMQFLFKQKLIGVIKNLFEEFKIFINYPDLVLPEIEFINVFQSDRYNISPSYVMITDSANQKPRFKTELLNLPMLGVGVQSHYFHEFTHLWDYNTYKTSFNLSDISLYTEFHATSIGMKKAMKFTSNSEIKKVYLYDEIFIEEKVTRLDDYMRKLTSDYHHQIPIWINKFKSNNTPENAARLCSKLLNHYTYYFSKVNFLNLYCNDNFVNLIDYCLFIDIFSNKAKEAYELLKSPIIDDSILNEIKNLKNEIVINFARRCKNGSI